MGTCTLPLKRFCRSFNSVDVFIMDKTYSVPSDWAENKMFVSIRATVMVVHLMVSGWWVLK